MPSFLSILKTIGTVAQVAEPFAEVSLSLFNPAAGAALHAIFGLVTKAEQTYTGEKQGTTKKQVVMDEFEAMFPLFQTVLKEQAGLLLTFDSAQVGNLVDATIAQLNAAKALHDTFKIQKL